MKVNQNFRLQTDSIPIETKVQSQGTIKFQELVKSQSEKLQMGQLQSILVEIEKAGERLSKSRNFRDLTKYKKLVQDFLKEAVNLGIGLKKSHSWDQYGQSRVLQIVEKIDEKLIELTDELLVKEKDHIDILGILGEIKGLLINLYT